MMFILELLDIDGKELITLMREKPLFTQDRVLCWRRTKRGFVVVTLIGYEV